MGARDDDLPPPQPIVGRLARSHANFSRLPDFAAAALIVTVAGLADRYRARRVALPRVPDPLSAALRSGRARGPAIAFMVSVVGILLVLRPALAAAFG